MSAQSGYQGDCFPMTLRHLVHQSLAAGARAVQPRLEAKPGILSAHAPTTAALVRALESAGIESIDENGGGAGVRMKKSYRKRPWLLAMRRKHCELTLINETACSA